jgi:hypothetical protein
MISSNCLEKEWGDDMYQGWHIVEIWQPTNKVKKDEHLHDNPCSKLATLKTSAI